MFWANSGSNNNGGAVNNEAGAILDIADDISFVGNSGVSSFVFSEQQRGGMPAYHIIPYHIISYHKQSKESGVGVRGAGHITFIIRDATIVVRFDSRNKRKTENIT